MAAKRKQGRGARKKSTDKAIVIGTDERGADTLSVQTDSMPAPSRFFTADFAFLKSTADDIKLVFVQTDPLTDEAVSTLVIRMTPHGFRQFVSHDGFVENLITNFGEDDEGQRKQDAEYANRLAQKAAVRSVTERASFARSSFFSADAEVDFFFISPNRFQDAKAGQGKAGLIVPVASVSMSAQLLGLLMQRGRALVEE